MFLASTCFLLLAQLCSGTSPVEIVLARCKEDISWVNDLNYGSITTVYDKCGVHDGPGTHLQQPNVGREGGTFLQHIVSRYETLADWTVFSQAEKPTYGYQGHRLGGGHMMNNLRFEDYVQAASNRVEIPRFFIFTHILVMQDGTIFQCIRQGYGNDYVPPKDGITAAEKCGSIGVWNQWFEFPGWFKDMVARLQQEQRAPFQEFRLEQVLQLFDIAPTANVMFFAQGARFAVSREAIHSRPKSYYEMLLTHMNHEDPWAGYFLEWLWWYVLGGSAMPCGFETSVVQVHAEWKNQFLLSHQKFITTDAVSSDKEIVFSGVNVFDKPQTIIVAPGTTIRFAAGSINNITAPISIRGGGRFIAEEGAIFMFSAPVLLEVAAYFTGVAFALESGATLKFRNNVEMHHSEGNGDGMMVFDLPDGNSTNASGFSILLNESTTTVNFTLMGSPDANRRIDTSSYAVAEACGTILGPISLDSNSALELQLNCVVPDEPYSNTIESLAYVSGSLVSIVGISAQSLPTLINEFKGTGDLPLEVNIEAGTPFTAHLIVYPVNPGQDCSSFWQAIIPACGAELTCEVFGHPDPTDSSRCAIYYRQTASKNDGLLGLVALLIFLPIAILVIHKFLYRPKKVDNSEAPLDNLVWSNNLETVSANDPMWKLSSGLPVDGINTPNVIDDYGAVQVPFPNADPLFPYGFDTALDTAATSTTSATTASTMPPSGSFASVGLAASDLMPYGEMPKGGIPYGMLPSNDMPYA